jgi:hypothetical protein
MVARGISLDRVASGNTRLLRIYRRRRGFDWAIERLGRPTPRMHQSGRVAVVTLLELWAHHEDALLANGLTCDSGVDLGPVVELLRRYQRKAIAAHNLEVSGSLQEQARVLAGRADIDGIRLGI